MSIVLDVAHPVQFFKQKFLKTGYFHQSVQLHFLMRPNEQKTIFYLMRVRDPSLEAYQKKTMDSITNNDHVYCITPSSQKFISDLCLHFL